MINIKLKKYIEEEIIPRNDLNGKGHDATHVYYVLIRSLRFANYATKINYIMLYVIVAYHDLGFNIDENNHEKISAQILLNDKYLAQFFSKEEMQIMAEAIEDHRANLQNEPRSIYGKIISSAERNTLIDNFMQKIYFYCLKHFPNSDLDSVLEISRQHVIEKYGKKGYARNKIYFPDLDYERFLNKIQNLIEDYESFYQTFLEVNEISFPRKIVK